MSRVTTILILSTIGCCVKLSYQQDPCNPTTNIVLSAGSGVITSPDYPNKHQFSDHHDCNWVIDASASGSNAVVRLAIEDFCADSAERLILSDVASEIEMTEISGCSGDYTTNIEYVWSVDTQMKINFATFSDIALSARFKLAYSTDTINCLGTGTQRCEYIFGTANSVICDCCSGFSNTSTVNTCSDVDDCLSDNGGCSPSADCVGDIGFANCTCHDGFTGNGTTCTDIDECEIDNGGCSTNASCTNTIGSVACMCDAGFKGNGKTCSPFSGRPKAALNKCSLSTVRKQLKTKTARVKCVRWLCKRNRSYRATHRRRCRKGRFLSKRRH